jgi:hypothetical protein
MPLASTRDARMQENDHGAGPGFKKVSLALSGIVHHPHPCSTPLQRFAKRGSAALARDARHLGLSPRTFLVISATAIAAIVQLRRLRGSNQIAAINELRETHETPAFAAARYFILVELNTLMEDPAFRYKNADRASGTGEMQAAIQKAVAVGTFYEGMGVLVEAGLVDRELALKIWSGIVTTAGKSSPL